MNPVKLFEKIERLETELVSLREKAATARRREDVHREQRVALLKQSSAREELLVSMERNVPEIKTLEEFRAIYPAIPWKKVPGNERLTHDAFGMSVDRDEQVFAKILRFFIDREEMFDNIQKHDFRQVNNLFLFIKI